METATQTLHRLTSYQAFDPDDPERVWEPPVDDPRVLQDLVVNDIARLPWFYKRYPQPLPRVPLPRRLPVTTAPAVEVLAGTAVVPRTALDLPQLSRLLHLSAGVVRTTERPYGTYLFRAAGSAGGRFPMELYVAVPESARVAPGARVPAGVHWYHPQDHALVQVGPPPHGDSPVVVVTGVPWRTGWRYRERGYRHVYWDAGTMLSQLLAAAESAGITARLHSRFPDEAVTALVGADGVHEWPAAVVALGDGTPALDPAGPAAAGCGGRGDQWSSRSSRPRSERASKTRSGRPGIAALRPRCRLTAARQSRLSSFPEGRSAAWTPPADCRRPCCAPRWRYR